MKSKLARWINGAAWGAATMYFSDQSQGKRRRALVRDKMRSLAVTASDAVDAGMRDLGHRLDGMQARANRLLSRRDETPDDQTLAARVRAKLGRAVSNPHAITVSVHEGRLTLSGPILTHEKPLLLITAKAVPGVTSVDDKLETHEQSEGIAALQGSSNRHPKFLQESWTPALRGIATVGGAALGGYGFARRRPMGTLLAIAGLALLARGVSNMPLKRLINLNIEDRGEELPVESEQQPREAVKPPAEPGQLLH